MNSYNKEFDRFVGIVNTFKEASIKKTLYHHPLEGVYLEENYANDKAMYQLKYFLSVVMLLPVLWLNLKGDYCTKPESFKKIEKHFSENDLELLKRATNIRQSWNGQKIQDNHIPDWIKKELGENYFTRGATLATKMFDKLS